MSESIQDVFDGLPTHPDFPCDPDIRLDEFGDIVERHSHGAVHSFSWGVDENGRAIGNIVGKPSLTG